LRTLSRGFMSTPSIEVVNLGKQYRIGALQVHSKTVGEAFGDMFMQPYRSMRSILRGNSQWYQGDEIIWALKNVSFEVHPGEIIGIIGPNGAGKSTLLKILTRIIHPTEGYAKIRGRVGSLLEVGTGFNAEMTGRENIYMSGAILGMRKAEIDRKFDEIVAFAEVEQFIDTPVKRYSSGMYLRLAFAVAAHLEPDVLLVDEVLAVGDIAFQKKCIGKMGDVTESGRAVLFVSHNIPAITALCSRTILITKGCVEMDGPTPDVIAHYIAGNAIEGGTLAWEHGLANPDITEFLLHRVSILNSAGQISSSLDIHDPFTVRIEYEILKPVTNCRVAIRLINWEGIVIINPFDVDNPENSATKMPGRYVATCEIPADLLSPGSYLISVGADIQSIKVLVHAEHVLSFSIEDTGKVGWYRGGKRLGVIRPSIPWHIETL
jgi:lipopolysaccharide transport system ATP-binding protein